MARQWTGQLFWPARSLILVHQVRRKISTLGQSRRPSVLMSIHSANMHQLLISPTTLERTKSQPDFRPVYCRRLSRARLYSAAWWLIVQSLTERLELAGSTREKLLMGERVSYGPLHNLATPGLALSSFFSRLATKMKQS